MKKGKVIISGAGLAGSLLASCLANRGFDITVYERRPDMRSEGFVGGRSINLALSNRGLRALEKVNMASEVLKHAIPMHGRMMHPNQGENYYQPYGTEGQYINSVSRGGLNLKLIELADSYSNVNLHFNHAVQDIDFKTSTLTVRKPDGSTLNDQADVILATDGAYSPIRLAMQKTLGFNYSQQYERYGYKELEIKPNEAGSFKMDPNSLHIWPRGEFMMIALPNPDGSFTCTLFMPYQGQPGFDSLNTPEDVSTFFENYFPDSVPLIHNLTQTFFQNPTGALVTVRCNPWVMNNTALMGDAAHAIVPFYGQGMNAAFEDVAVLDTLLTQHPNQSWSQILQQYQEERIPNANAIADLALQNFIEMRDLVGRPEFIAFKEIENQLCTHHANDFKSQYELVTFSDVPYHFALKMGNNNKKLIEHILQNNLQDRIGDSNWFHHLATEFNLNYQAHI